MQLRGAGVVAAAGAMVLSACASTSVASTPVPTTIERPVPETVAATIAPTTEATTTTTQPPTTTLPPETVPPTTVPPPPPPTIPTVPLADPVVAAVGDGGGAETARAQHRLLELGFWVDLREVADGSYGLTTRQAVMAFQKYYGIETDGVLGQQTAMLMTAAAEKPRGRADAGTLVEIDKNRQLIFFVVDGRTEWILNTSTGSEIAYDEPDKNTPGERQVGDSITRTGLHSVYRERPDGWWEGDLGEIYRPKYFSGGQAVHGSNSIPDYPASHGCVRVSVTAMDWIWESGIMPKDIPVWVHGSIPGK